MKNHSDNRPTGTEKTTKKAAFWSAPVMITLAVIILAASAAAAYFCFFTKIGSERFFISSKEIDLYDAGLTSVDGLEKLTAPKHIDLRSNNIPEEEIIAFSSMHPDCTILFDITLDGTRYDCTTDSIVLCGLSDDAIDKLRFFSNLSSIDARGLELDLIDRLHSEYPDCQIIWDIEICGQRYPSDIEELVIPDASAEDIARLSRLTSLKKVDATGCTAYAELLEASRALPECEFIWVVDIGGMQISNSSEKIDFGRKKVKDIDALGRDFEKLKYLPALKEIDMCGCGVSNAQMGKWRDTYPDYKFVWEITIGSKYLNWTLRTDIKVFSTLLGSGASFGDENMYRDLFLYCTDLVALDLGHNKIEDISLITNLQKLQAIILTDNPVKDLSPLGELPELVYAELNMTGITDVSSFANCRNLQHLDIYATNVKDVSALYNSTSLKYLIVAGSGVKGTAKAKMAKTNPDCRMVFSVTGEGSKLRNNHIRSEYRLALCNWRVVEDIVDYENITFKEGAKLTYPKGYRK